MEQVSTSEQDSTNDRSADLERLRQAVIQVADHATVVAILLETPENAAYAHCLNDLKAALELAKGASVHYETIAGNRETSVGAFGDHYSSATHAVIILGRGLAYAGGLVSTPVHQESRASKEQIAETFASLKAVVAQEFSRLIRIVKGKPGNAPTGDGRPKDDSQVKTRDADLQKLAAEDHPLFQSLHPKLDELETSLAHVALCSLRKEPTRTLTFSRIKELTLSDASDGDNAVRAIFNAITRVWPTVREWLTLRKAGRNREAMIRLLDVPKGKRSD